MPRPAAAGHDAGMPVPETMFTTTAVLARPGARLVYEVAGDGPAVVLVHGFGLDLQTALAAPARVRALDEVTRQVRAGGVPAGRAAGTPTPRPTLCPSTRWRA
jgi:hypothetical protein